MQVATIEQIVRRGGSYLAESLLAYWPAIGGHEITERNITLHAGRAFADRDFHIYAECAPAQSPKEHVDLLALHPDGIQVTVEAKRLYSSEKLGQMVDDLEKIQRFELPNEDWAGIKIAQRYGVLLATTWNKDYAAWWSSGDEEGDHPTPHENWDKLSDHKALQNAKWGSVVLRGYEDSRRSEDPFHYLLYCIWEMTE